MEQEVVEAKETINDFAKAFNLTVESRITQGIKQTTPNIVLGELEKAYIINLCRIAVENHFKKSRVSEAELFDIPETLKGFEASAFVTFYLNGKMCGCRGAMKPEMSFISKILRSAKSAITDDRFKGAIKRSDLGDLIIDVTIFTAPTHCKMDEENKLRDQIELGIHSFRVISGDKQAFFKSSVPIARHLTLSQAMRRLCRKAGLDPNAYKLPETEIIRYETLQFSQPYDLSDSQNIVTKYRNQKIYHQKDVTRLAIERGAKQAGRFMTKHVKQDGRLTYHYDPVERVRDFSNKNVAVLRRIASTWILAELGNYFSEPSFINAAKRSVDYMLRKFYKYDPEQQMGYMVIGNNATVGLAGFMLATMVTIDDPDFFPEVTHDLKNFIMKQVNMDEGYMYPTYLPDKLHGFEGKQLYYPGEAMTALMKYHQRFNAPECVEALGRCFEYYSNLFDATEKKINMAAWMSKPFGALFVETNNKKYADFVLRINDFVISRQHNLNTPYVDRMGSFTRSGDCCSTGVFVESIAEGYMVAKILGDEKRMKNYCKSMLMGLRYILQCQYRQDNCDYPEIQELLLGGIKTGLYDQGIRIDNVQHSACAMLKSLTYLDLKYF